jgi:hypothetical protein
MSGDIAESIRIGLGFPNAVPSRFSFLWRHPGSFSVHHRSGATHCQDPPGLLGRSLKQFCILNGRPDPFPKRRLLIKTCPVRGPLFMDVSCEDSDWRGVHEGTSGEIRNRDPRRCGPLPRPLRAFGMFRVKIRIAVRSTAPITRAEYSECKARKHFSFPRECMMPAQFRCHCVFWPSRW